MRGLLGHEILKPRPDTMFIWENVGYNFWNVGNLGYRDFRYGKNFQAKLSEYPRPTPFEGPIPSPFECPRLPPFSALDLLKA